MQDTIIVIPCYNEEDRLLCSEFIDYVQYNESVNFLFVNDCSVDGTGQMIDELCATYPHRLQAMHLLHNVGKAEAVRAGFVALFPNSYKNIGFWDADLATPLSEIEEFRRFLDCPKVEIVLGSRVRLMGRQIERQAMRHYLGRIFATVASSVLGVKVYDTQCGAKLFRNTKCLRQIFADPFLVNWTFDVELLARYIALADGTVNLENIAVEKPLQQWLEVPGSKLKITDFIKAIGELVTIWRYLHHYSYKTSAK